MFDFQNPSSAAKRRQLTCSDDDLAILSAFVRGKPGLQLGKLPPHSRLSVPVLRDTVGFTHGYPLSPHSRLSIAIPVGSKAQHDCLSHVDVFIRPVAGCMSDRHCTGSTLHRDRHCTGQGPGTIRQARSSSEAAIRFHYETDSRRLGPFRSHRQGRLICV